MVITPTPPYTKIKVYQLVAFLKVINLPSLEMKPYLEQYAPTSIPEEARPTPLPIVDGAEMVSDDSDDDIEEVGRLIGTAQFSHKNVEIMRRSGWA